MGGLYPILRKADGKAMPTGFRRVVVDAAGKPLLQKSVRQWLGGMLTGVSWYVLPDTPCRLDHRTIQFTEWSLDDTAEASVVIDVTLPKSEDALAEAVAALTKDGDPEVGIIDTVRRAMQAAFRENSKSRKGLLALERVARLQDVLSKKAEEEAKASHVKLDVQLIVNPQDFDAMTARGAEVVKDLRIAIPDFDVSLQNRLSHRVPLALDLLLQRGGDVLVTPPKDDQAWRDLLRQNVVEAAARELSVSDYYGDRESLGAKIGGLLAKALQPFGRSVNRIDVRTRSQFAMPSSQTIDTEIVWIGKPSGHPTGFRLSATLRVNPDKQHIFISKEAPAFRRWFETNAKDALEEELVSADYVHLTTDYVDELQRRLEENLNVRAAEYGLSINPFVAKPNVPEIVRTRRISFNTGKTQYQTRDGSFKVDLEISVAGRFTSLDHVTALLSPPGSQPHAEGENELTDRMKRATIAAAAQVLRDADAKRYVLHFEAGVDPEDRKDDLHAEKNRLIAFGSGKGPASEGKSDGKTIYLAEMIRSKVAAELLASFGCKAENIQIVQKDDRTSELIQWIFELGTFSIPVEVEPRDCPGEANRHEVVVTYQVCSVDSASILSILRHGYDRKRLHEHIINQLTTWTRDVLSALTASMLRSRDVNERWNLRNELDSAVQKQFKRFFGAEVSALSIVIEPSPSERLALEKGEEALRLDFMDMMERKERISDPEYRAERRRQIADETERAGGSRNGGGAASTELVPRSRRQDGNKL